MGHGYVDGTIDRRRDDIGGWMGNGSEQSWELGRRRGQYICWAVLDYSDSFDLLAILILQNNLCNYWLGGVAKRTYIHMDVAWMSLGCHSDVSCMHSLFH